MNPLDSALSDMIRKYSFTSSTVYQFGGATEKPSSEFSGREFAAGVARGARSFRADRLGRLTGVHHQTVWRPGENDAECRAYDSASAFIRDEPDRKCPGLADCKHGFYGYYDGSDDYHESGMISGVIEGYGEAVIGSRGFRSMKARIVALHIPAEVNAGLRRLIIRNYPDVPVFDTFEQMVAEVQPDDGGEGISPENDPDFWTRRA